MLRHCYPPLRTLGSYRFAVVLAGSIPAGVVYQFSFRHPSFP